MKPSESISRAWASTPLGVRLLGIILLMVLLIASVRTSLMAFDGKDIVLDRLTEKLAMIRTGAPSQLAERLKSGDPLLVERFLQHELNIVPELAGLVWNGADGTRIEVARRESRLERAPAWLVARLDLQARQATLPVETGGTSLGSLHVDFDTAYMLYPVWQQLVTQVRAVVVVLLVIALLVWLVLRSTLKGLRELKKAVQTFESGDHSVRAALHGAPELRAATTGFNAMAEQVERLVCSIREEKEQVEITLASIGDAVITTDAAGRITLLNPVAAKMTGWTPEEASGRPLAAVFHIINEVTRKQVENPVELIFRHGNSVSLANHTVLISRDGMEYCIEDSAAPIRLADGTLIGCVLVFRDVTDKKKLLNTIEWQAGHDVLTGLPNRALLADRFQRAMAAAQRQGRLLGVCLLDLDGFKPVNDRYGHETGDQLLMEMARRLGSSLRGGDSVARLGGDEFVLLLGDAQNVEEIYTAIQRTLDAVGAPFQHPMGAITVSGSIGLTVYPFDEADSDTLLRHADQAMYQAKQKGRNRYHLFNVLEDIEVQAVQRSLLRLREALHGGELVLHYQPKVNLRNGSVTGMEALLRWQHPQDGLIPPLDFLPLAEQTDLIVDIGEWVTEQALQQMEQWQAAGMVWPVSVNIAAYHFQREDFAPRLEAILARHPALPPAMLELEILESVALDDLQQARGKIIACQRLGVSFALDDFGTGYASLRYLKHLPAETLKIDQSFVRGLLDDAQDITIVEAVISLARLFNRSVIAEGVESADHGVLLMRLGCNEAQGYGIARPMPAAQVAAWVQNYRPEPKWALWADKRWEMNNLPLLVAQHDHLQWVRRVTLAVENAALGLSLGELKDHHQCRFGHWYYGHGKAHYGHLAEFAAIEPVHVRVHEIGTEIIRLRDAGETASARERCHELRGLKDRIVALTDALQAAVLRTSQPD